MKNLYLFCFVLLTGLFFSNCTPQAIPSSVSTVKTPTILPSQSPNSLHSSFTATPSLVPIPSATSITPTAPIPMVTITTIPISTEHAATPIPAKNGWQNEYLPSIETMFLSKDASLEEITVLLFAQKLEHFRTVDASSNFRLNDYQILNVSKLTNEEGASIYAKSHEVDFVMSVVYSVKPYIQIFSIWNAGNGTDTDNFTWIRNKFLLVGIWKQNNTWFLKGIGTGG